MEGRGLRDRFAWERAPLLRVRTDLGLFGGPPDAFEGGPRYETGSNLRTNTRGAQL